MAYTDLTSLLTAIANAIRAKKGTTAQINAQNFPSEIASISTGITIKTQTVSQTINMTSGEQKTVTFTFNNLKKVLGVSKIYRPYNTSQAYSSHQKLDSRYYVDLDPIIISGNTVKLVLTSMVDTNSQATWSVTAIGE